MNGFLKGRISGFIKIRLRRADRKGRVVSRIEALEKVIMEARRLLRRSYDGLDLGLGRGA